MFDLDGKNINEITFKCIGASGSRTIDSAKTIAPIPWMKIRRNPIPSHMQSPSLLQTTPIPILSSFTTWRPQGSKISRECDYKRFPSPRQKIDKQKSKPKRREIRKLMNPNNVIIQMKFPRTIKICF